MSVQEMETDTEPNDEVEEQEEYLLLDLDDVREQTNLPVNVPYVLSGLDTLNPVLIIGGRLKLMLLMRQEMLLIGEYQETVGTCYLFSERDGDAEATHPETAPSEANLFKERCISDPNQAPLKHVHALTSLQKILKFRLATEEEMKATDGNAAKNL